MAEYNGTVELIGGLVPKNNGKFPIASAKDIQFDSTEIRVYEKIIEIINLLSTHNTSNTAHSDIRELISGLTTRLNAIADSDDTTLDQLSEIVAYIKSNKDLIDAITTSKVNVSDIANDLETNSASKVLSAAQGVVIKALLAELEQKIADGPSITVDPVLSETSENPVQNKVITEALKIPTFDLAAMGLPAIALGTEGVMLQTDTSEIMTALSKGAVKFIVNMDNGDGTSSPAELTMNSVQFEDGSYVCTYSYMAEVLYTFGIVIMDGVIVAGCVPLQNNSIPTFDLASMGLPTVVMEGGVSSLEADMTEIINVLDKGSVKFIVNASMFESTVATEIIPTNICIDSAGMYICSCVFDFNGVALVFTLNIKASLVTAQFTHLQLYSSDSDTIPTFDLTSMGLAALPMGGTSSVSLETDTSEIMAALAKGAVKFIVNMDNGDGTSSPVEVIMNNLFCEGMYACSYTVTFDGPILIQVVVMDGMIAAFAAAIQSGGTSGTSAVDILSEQTLDNFTLNNTYGLYEDGIAPPPFTLVLGQSYTVVWDGTSYECVAQDMSAAGEGMLALGNLSNFGGSGNNEPFIIGWSQVGVSFFSFDTETSHTVRIYQTQTALPAVSTNDNGKLMQVVDGVWTPVTIENSAIKTYIDSYIDEALGGDY